MKRLLLVPLIIILAVSLVLGSCGEPEETTTTTTAAATTTAATTTAATTTAATTTAATTTAATTTAATTTAATTTPSDEVIQLTFSYHATPFASLVKGVFVPWADAIEEASNGRVEIVHHSGGSLFGSTEAYDGLIAGLCDIAQIETEAYPGQFPRTGINALPFLYPDAEVAGMASHLFVNKYCADTELSDVKVLLTAPLWPQHYWGNEPIETMEDFAGLVIRTPGTTMSAVIEALGATPQEVDTSELSSALDTGLIDGCFFTWSGGKAFGLTNSSKYRTECGITTDVYILAMNKDAYESLPADIQQIFDEFSTPEVSRQYGAAHQAMEAATLAEQVESDATAGNEEIYTLPADELARWKAAVASVADDWVAEMEDEGLPGQEMLDDLISWVEQYSQ